MIFTSIRQLLFWTLLCGVLYPLAVTGIAQLLMPAQANGSIGPHGSPLIGQQFSQPGYFWSRPSATAEKPYNAASSSGSNLGPLEPKLVEARKGFASTYGPGAPPDLLCASGSGLDPHISPAAARFQVARVARARGVKPDAIEPLLAAATEPPQLAVLGAPRVNVLLLNEQLDARLGPARKESSK